MPAVNKPADELWLPVAAFVVLRAYAVLRAPVHFPDSPSYVPLDFLGHQERLWTVPLIYNVFPTDALREVAQFVLGTTAWVALAAAVRNALNSIWVRRAAAVVVLLLGLVPQVTGWDSALLSESVATSLLVLLVALLLRLARRPTPSLLAACLTTAILWEFTRQENAIELVALLPFIVLAAFRWLPRRQARVAAATLCLLALSGGYEALFATGDRPVVRNNALQIIENRMAPDRSALNFLIARGLPLSPEILVERGAFKGGISPLYNDQRLMSWIDDHWKSAYIAYLLRHPRHTLVEPLKQTPGAISGPVSTALRARAVLPIPVRDALWSTSQGDIPFWLAAAAVLLLACYRLGAPIRAAPLVAFTVLFAVVGAELTWTLTGYGQGPELGRQFMFVAVSIRLALLLAITFAIDAILVRSRT